MKKPIKTSGTFLAALAGAALAVAPGCATISVSEPGALDSISVKGAGAEPLEHVCLATTGEYMFWSLPIASGRFHWNEKTGKLEPRTSWFSDCVGVSELQEALQKYAESKGCDLVDVSYFDADTSYAGASYEGLLGIFFGSSQMGVSGVLVPRKISENN